VIEPIPFAGCIEIDEEENKMTTFTSEDLKAMQKPVAWRIQDKHGEWLYYGEPVAGAEPLYTHPHVSE
jgi:hypothetical protein